MNLAQLIHHRPITPLPAPRKQTVHKMGKCNICKTADRSITSSGWVDAYCVPCRNKKRRDHYAKTITRE